MKIKELIITLFFILVLLIICAFFPAEKALQQILTLFVFFVALPVIFNKFFLKKKLGDLGIKIGNYRSGLIFSVASVLIVVSILFLIVKYTSLSKYIIIPTSIAYDFKAFLFYELFLVAFTVFVYELFFRGFLMFNLINKTNYWFAIIVQAFVFFVFMGSMSNPFWGFLPYLIFSPIAGLIAFKSGSIIYSGISQLIIIILLHIIIIKTIAG